MHHPSFAKETFLFNFFHGLFSDSFRKYGFPPDDVTTVFGKQLDSETCFRSNLARLILSTLAICLLSVSFNSQLKAEETSTVIKDVEIGWLGVSRIGKWTPVRVSLDSKIEKSAAVFIEAFDPTGDVVSFPLNLSSDGDVPKYTGLIKIGKLNSSIRVVVKSPTDGEKKAKNLAVKEIKIYSKISSGMPFRTIRDDVNLILTLGETYGFDPNEASEEEEDENRSKTDNRETIVLSIKQEDWIPVKNVFDGIDALVIAGDFDVTNTISKSIQEYVLGGGHLLVTVGKEAKQYRESRISKWIPINVDKESKMYEMPGLESYSLQPSPIRIRRPIPAIHPSTKENYGRILADELNGPILVRIPLGFGRITFLGVDLNSPAFKEWPPLNSFCNRLLDLRGFSAKKVNIARQNRAKGSGITDLKTQLSAANSNFSNIQRASLWSVLLWMFVYLIFVGPVDYFLVRKVFKKPQLTWITLPLWVLLAVFLATSHSNYDNGTFWQQNQLEVIDYDIESGTQRGYSWNTLYSPETRRYDLEIKNQNETDTVPTQMIWSGNPEEGFGGMYREGNLAFGGSRYGIEFQKEDQVSKISKMPMRIWSTRELQNTWKSFLSEKDAPTKKNALFESSLYSNTVGQLRGTITSHLSVPIHNWMILYRKKVYTPKSNKILIPSGVSWSPNSPKSVQINNAKNLLTGTWSKTVEEENSRFEKVVSEDSEYLPSEKEPLRILHMLTFYRVVDGKNYTTLKNDVLDDMDCSPLVGLGRAILLGEIQPQSKTEMSVNGQTNEPTNIRQFVRIVIPIDRIEKEKNEFDDFYDQSFKDMKPEEDSEK